LYLFIPDLSCKYFLIYKILLFRILGAFPADVEVIPRNQWLRLAVAGIFMLFLWKDLGRKITAMAQIFS
jgi:hypothetical protein